MIDNKLARPYIERIRHDPRTRAMMQGWVAQATAEAEMRYPDPRDDRQRAHMAAELAIGLAMSFVLDNDGELRATQEQLDRVLKQAIEAAFMKPLPMIFPAES